MSSIKVIQMSIPTAFDVRDQRVVQSINSGMRAIGQAAYIYWKSLADSTLHTTYQDYVSSLEVKFAPDAHGIEAAEIGISGFLPMAVEFGTPSFDMKQRLSGSGHTTAQVDLFRGRIRVSKDGKRYAIIPMRHATQGSAGNRRMHVPPPPIVKEMKYKRVGFVMRGVDDKYKTANQHTGYMSKVPRYEKLTKKAGGWFTFRTMSENSDPLSWIHKGFQPRLLHERVMLYVENTLSSMMLDPLIRVLRSQGAVHSHGPQNLTLF